jgi:hypothetical protein
MLTYIENTIQKIIQEFIWDGKNSPQIGMNTLQQPMKQGGLNLLDIKAQNEAIDIMWLKDYLNFSLSRPTWAVLIDLLINATTPLNISPLGRFNTYTQNWNPPTRGPRLSSLNKDIRRMIKTAKKYNTNLTALQIASNVSARLPAWYHINAKPHPLTSIASKCLIRNHNIATVADMVRTALRAQPNRSNPHTPNLLCVCAGCTRDRLKGCRNPHECVKEALAKVTDIAPKFNP